MEKVIIKFKNNDEKQKKTFSDPLALHEYLERNKDIIETVNDKKLWLWIDL